MFFSSFFLVFPCFSDDFLSFSYGFPIFSVNILSFLLVLGHFGVQNRILHVKLYVFPAGKVCRSKFFQKMSKIMFLNTGMELNSVFV